MDNQERTVGGYTLIPDTIGGIPATEMSMIEKVLLCKIISLSKGRPCEMSNAAFASCFGVTCRRITKHIAGLKEKGWIEITGPRTKRYIKPTEKALSLWTVPSIDGTVYRRNHLKTETSSTIDGSVLNYGRKRLPKNIENIESINTCANPDLHKCAPSQNTDKKKADKAAREKMFAEFWKAYPRGQNKARSKAAFLRIKNLDKLFPVIMQALERQKGMAQWKKNDGQYIPLASTWLNGKRWEDVEQVDVKQPQAAALPKVSEMTPERQQAEEEEQRRILQALRANEQ